MLRATWCALRGWETLLAARSRIPVTRWVLEALVLAGLAQGLEEQGRHRREWWASALGWRLAFESLLRPSDGMYRAAADPLATMVDHRTEERFFGFWVFNAVVEPEIARSRKLREACNWLNIGNLGYTLSSFRSGGATHQFRSHGNLEGRADFAVLYPGINLFNATSFVTEQGKQRASAIREGVRWLEAPPLAPCASLVRG